MLYKTSNSSHTHLQFRIAVIESLASLHLQEAPERHRGRPFVRHLSDTSTIVDPKRLNRKPHFLSKREQRQCVVCSTPQMRRRSVFYATLIQPFVLISAMRGESVLLNNSRCLQ